MDVTYYTVRSGDSLSAIATRQFGKVSPQLLAEIVAMNASISNPNLIHPGDVLALPSNGWQSNGVSSETRAFAEVGKQLRPLSEPERGLLATLLATSPEELAAEAFFDTVDRRMTIAQKSLKAITDNYEAYKAKAKTKGAYDSSRRVAIQQHDTGLGILRGLTYGPKSSGELLRIQRGKGLNATGKIEAAKSLTKRTLSLAKTGNIVLTAVNLGTTCADIATAQSGAEKSGILVESAGGAIGGGVAVAVGILLFGTPAGWVAVAALTVGASVAGTATGFGARRLYDRYGNGVDLAKATKVSSVCVVPASMR